MPPTIEECGKKRGKGGRGKDQCHLSSYRGTMILTVSGSSLRTTQGACGQTLCIMVDKGKERSLERAGESAGLHGSSGDQEVVPSRKSASSDKKAERRKNRKRNKVPLQEGGKRTIKTLQVVLGNRGPPRDFVGILDERH